MAELFDQDRNLEAWIPGKGVDGSPISHPKMWSRYEAYHFLKWTEELGW